MRCRYGRVLLIPFRYRQVRGRRLNTLDDDLNLMRLTWRRIGQVRQLNDGSWRAGFPCSLWWVNAPTKEEAEEKAVQRALDEGDDPEWVMQRIVESFNAFVDYSPDDLPKGTWVFRLQTERFANGTWRAWFPSGGWVTRAATEKEAKFAAATEWYRRVRLPDEVARRHATMRRHLEDPVSGVEFFPYEQLPESVRRQIEQHEGGV
jgi:hypothetical protein